MTMQELILVFFLLQEHFQFALFCYKTNGNISEHLEWARHYATLICNNEIKEILLKILLNHLATNNLFKIKKICVLHSLL